MAEWLPIESAPKDGTRIVVFGTAQACGGNQFELAAAVHVGSWRYGRWSVDPYDYYDVTIQPTHWMPLPAPPAVEE